MQIPKIIHQIWEGKTSQLPKELAKMAETWKTLNPEWEYRLWGKEQMINFVFQYFPDLMEIYNEFPENVQRWDTVRCLILYIQGGVYVDVDTECLKPIDQLLENKSCCFGEEPPEHAEYFNVDYLIGTAFIAAIPNHPFLKMVIDEIKNYKLVDKNLFHYVMETTGPLMIDRVYRKYNQKEEINLIDYKLVTPITSNEMLQIMQGNMTSDINKKLSNAYAVHYFFNLWVKNNKGIAMNNLLNESNK